MLTWFLTAVHVIVAVVLIVVVLMQSQQSMNLSGMFGGASQSALGSKPQSVLGKTTTVLAIVFMATSLFFMLYPPTQQGGGALEPEQGNTGSAPLNPQQQTSQTPSEQPPAPSEGPSSTQTPRQDGQ